LLLALQALAKKGGRAATTEIERAIVVATRGGQRIGKERLRRNEVTPQQRGWEVGSKSWRKRDGEGEEETTPTVVPLLDTSKGMGI
jgi:hypothetical protein